MDEKKKKAVKSAMNSMGPAPQPVTLGSQIQWQAPIVPPPGTQNSPDFRDKDFKD